MIYHTVRLTIRPGIATNKVEEALESMRNQGRVIPSVISFVVGQDVGGEYEWGATYVIKDLDGYWEYLLGVPQPPRPPAHRRDRAPTGRQVRVLRRHRR